MAGNAAELIFKIKADGSNAEAELRKVEAQIKKLAGNGDIEQFQKGFKGAASEASNLVAIFTGNRLSGATSQLTALGGAIGAIPGPVGLAVGAVGAYVTIVAALGTAAVAAGVELFQLTEHAAEWASKLHDARDETGLSAATLSTLKFAADNANSSFETVTKATAKFAILLGEAEKGSSSAQQKLRSLGVTSNDLETALGQATATIFKASDGVEQITLAGDAFGKKMGAEMIPVIKQMDGSTAEYTKRLEELGATITDKDIIAADNFGDALGLLKQQAEAAGVSFTSSLMPVLTEWFTTASEYYGRNKDQVRDWGITVTETVQGAAQTIRGLESIATGTFSAIDSILGNNQASWSFWATNARVSIAFVTGGLSELLLKMHQLGASTSPVGAFIGGSINVPGGGGAPPGGGGGGKGGGGGPKDKEYQEAKKRADQLIKLYNDSAANRVKANDLALEQMQEDEEKHVREKNQIELDKLNYAREQYQAILGLDKLTEQQKEEIQAKIDDLVTKSYGLQIDLEKDLHHLKMEDDKLDYENYKKTLENKRKLDEEYRQNRILRAKQATDLANAGGLSDNAKDFIKLKNSANLSILGDSMLSIRNEAGNLENTFKPILPLLQDMGQMVGQVAQGFGQLLNTWILMGSVGPHAVRKMVAQVISSFATMAAVQSLMELAYGIAALTPWGAAIYGPAAPHFKAAALLGAAAATAAVVGRAVAGDSFKDATGGSGGSTSNGNNNSDNNSFSVPFGGYGSNRLSNSLDKMTLAAAQLEETNNHLARKLQSFSPGEVVAMGAADAADELHAATQGKLVGDPRASSQYFRNFGLVGR